MDPFRAVIEEELQQFAGTLPEGGRILDVGAGECPYRHLLAGMRYVAIDNGRGNPDWDYGGISAAADLEALPFADASFDAVMSICVLEHVAAPARTLREVRRVLKPGGRLFIAVPQFWELHQAPQDYFRYTRCGLDRLLSEAGFSPQQISPTGGYFHLLGKLSIDFLGFFERGAAWLLWVLFAPVCGGLIPFLCFYLDHLDRKKDFAVGFTAVAQAVSSSTTPAPHDRELALAGAAPER